MARGLGVRRFFALPFPSVSFSLAMSTEASPAKRRLLVLYGSETGNGESISKRIHQDALTLGYESEWAPMNDFKKVWLPLYVFGCVVAV